MTATFYIDGNAVPQVGAAFTKLSGGNIYQYYDFTHGNRRVVLSPTAQPQHPTHQERWKMVVGNNDHVFKGKTVCDVGGAEGFYSLRAALLGAKRVIMIERDKRRIDCAEFIFKFFGVSQVTPMPVSIQKMTHETVDILFLMRVLHWLIPHHEISEQERDRIIKSLFASFRKVAFINLNAKEVDTIKAYLKNMRHVESGDFGYFMGYIRAWRQ
jgi:hypothetical protein